MSQTVSSVSFRNGIYSRRVFTFGRSRPESTGRIGPKLCKNADTDFKLALPRKICTYLVK